MGFRMRRSFGVVPGVRVNVSTRSVGMTVGGKYVRRTVNSRTGTRMSYSLPGTGITYTTAPARSRARSAAPAPQPAKPGLFAPRGHKELYEAIHGDRYDRLEKIASDHPEVRSACMLLDAYQRVDTPATHRALRGLFEELWRSGYDPAGDPFVTTYLVGSQVRVTIASGIRVALPLSRLAIGLTLVEYRQEDNDLELAASLVEGLEPSAVTAVSLAELYGLLERWQAVVDLTEDITERDDLSLFLLIQRGEALRGLGHYDASREALKLALTRRTQPPELRHLALFERGQTALADGKRALARKDFERILAENADYPGLAEALASAR